MSDAHAVASHIVLKFGLDTMVGFNESSRGEGYVMVDPAIDIWKVVKEVTGSDPLRSLVGVASRRSPTASEFRRTSEFTRPEHEVPISRSPRNARYPLMNVDLARLDPRDHALLADPFPL
jgi:hypothetical protein